ncbi:MAG TPA: ATP-binding protein [Pyrinomonadaceae bacterium]|nr:ATP-binding protein [Pyrinomonadaceae bacterium]
MKTRHNFRLVIFFTVLTSALTLAVIGTWEKILRPPFYAWVDQRYPGPENAESRWKIEQRTEHFFISMTVDVVVVSILLVLVERQQKRLIGSEQRYRALFEHAHDGIGVIGGADFKLIEVNSKFARTFERDPRELAGQDVRELLTRRVIESSNGHSPVSVARLFSDPDASEIELMLGTETGGARLVGLSFSTITANDEHLIILLVRDLSTRKRLEDEKQEMQRQLYESAKLASLGELSAGVAHEINNPLNGVINFAQLLKDEPVERTRFERQMIDGIIDEGLRIAEIVRGLLTFARHDENEPRQICLAEMINTSIALFSRQFAKHGVRVEIDIVPDLPPVHGDVSRLRQVIVNMISNAHYALKAKSIAPNKEKVFRIQARSLEKFAGGRSQGAVVCLEFYDNGTGINRKDIPRVFDPFFTTRRDSGGTGLGLSISFGIVRDHGGTITVSSEEGRYTRFQIELPIAVRAEHEYV